MRLARCLIVSSLVALGAGTGCAGESASNCDPGCTGCCTEQGACIDTVWNGQCGASGALCVDCTLLSSSCELGACVCSGCFQEDGSCAAGKLDEECGSGGALCESCESPEICADGVCAAPPQCRPGECDGCCSGSDCVTGDADSACGKDGQACADCTASSAACDGDTRQCKARCGPATCTGCCVSAYECLEDASADTACGQHGGSCTDCTIEGQVCVAGACMDDSCPNTCAGCCDAARECHDGDELAACGLSGIDCRDCVDEIGVESSCSVGTCVANSCAATCGGGCCDGETCLDGDSPVACGTGGEGCVTCGANDICLSSACHLDPESRWDIVVDNAEVPLFDAEDASWDAFGGLPDVYIVVTAGLGTSYELTGQTDYVSNQILADYGGTVVLSNVPAKGIVEDLQFQWWDDDWPSLDDPMMTVNVTVDESLFGEPLLVVTATATEGDYIVRFHLVPASS